MQVDGIALILVNICKCLIQSIVTSKFRASQHPKHAMNALTIFRNFRSRAYSKFPKKKAILRFLKVCKTFSKE